MSEKAVVKSIDPIKTLDHILPKTTNNKNKVFRIGISANLGGHTRELYTGVAIAVNEYLKKKDRLYDIEVLWEKSSFDKDSTLKAANQLVNRGAEAVIGHLSANQSLVAATIYSDIDIPFLAPGTSHPLLTEQGFDNILRVCGRDEEMAYEMVHLADKLSANTSLKIIYQDNSYGNQLSKLLRKSILEKGLNLKSSILINDNIVSEIDDRDTLLFAGTYEGALVLTEKLAEVNFSGVIIFGDDIFVADFPYLISTHDGLKLFTISTKKELCGINYKKFENKYKEIASLKPAAYSVTSYIATKILLNNIALLKKYGYKTFINSLKDGVVVEGLEEVSFSPKGDLLEFEWDVYEMNAGEFINLNGSDR